MHELRSHALLGQTRVKRADILGVPPRAAGVRTDGILALKGGAPDLPHKWLRRNALQKLQEFGVVHRSYRDSRLGVRPVLKDGDYLKDGVDVALADEVHGTLPIQESIPGVEPDAGFVGAVDFC